ncbi:MAG: M48 family metallopeptidase [Candidatus Accumulibacter sp.]|jgi:predicted metal-dependent hydrolase|nr:M48 family metallopeptidase [Accumulibacter sp.]
MSRQVELPFFPAQPAGEVPKSIVLGERVVRYTLRRSRRRSIGLSVDHRGLRVAAPHRASLVDVEKLIHKHAAWVTQKLDEWRERRVAAPTPLADGTRLPYLGGWLEIRIASGASGDGRAVWADGDTPTLTLFPRSPADVEPLLGSALQRKALSLFGQRLERQAVRFGIVPPRLALSSARTRWGSCSLRTGIRLNWRLIHCALSLIDYVIVHELAHLEEMNHGPRFWAIVARYFPDHRDAREALKKLSGSLPVIGAGDRGQ